VNAAIRYVFLDRDGVINRKPPEGKYISDWAGVELLPRAAAAIAQLNQTGRKVIVITNQRGIALGYYTHQDLQLIHQKLAAHLATFDAHIDAFYYCPHDTNECLCRKPLPGLIKQAIADFPDAVAANSLVIGDSLADIQLGHKLGMKTFFIRGDVRTQKAGAPEAELLADRCFDSLADAVLETACVSKPQPQMSS
jgi:D-glycero-D-manno-heptose 1,7-bisphosphate phosphatase